MKRLRTFLPVVLVVAVFMTSIISSAGSVAWGMDASAADWAGRMTSDAEGGMVVHLSVDADPARTAVLRSDDRFLVEALIRDADQLQPAREKLRSAGLAGKVTVETWDGARLPYIDNLVRLLVIDAGQSPGDAEILRVLVPGGVAMIQKGDEWTALENDWPEDIDHWTHYLHDESGNAVAADSRVGPPRHMQFLTDPLWSRNHHTLASISSVVTDRGRLFYILDEGSAASIANPPRWTLVARDAFSGKLLWKRPMSEWASHLRKFRSGPVELPRKLVVNNDRVFVSLGLDVPAEGIDARTGETLYKLEGSELTKELLTHGSVVVAVVANPLDARASETNQRRGGKPSPGAKKPPASGFRKIAAFDTESGDRIWEKTYEELGDFADLGLAAADGRLLVNNRKAVLCFDITTGELQWQTPCDPSLTLVATEGLVFSASGKSLTVMDMDDGKVLWSCPSVATFRSAVDVLVIDGRVWLGPKFERGRDIHTGEVTKENIAYTKVETAGHHHRCYRNKATSRYLMTSHRGSTFFDLEGDNHSRNNWSRGTCQYGSMPANGLLYTPAHACGCYQEALLTGFWAHASSRETRLQPTPDAERLIRGPAYNVPMRKSLADVGGWPTLRGDIQRSGSTERSIKMPEQIQWRTELGGKLTAPTAAADKIFLADIDSGEVIALDAGDGSVVWRFAAGGRVDSPPTFYMGRLLFGSADGCVYCLQADDGRLAWRFQAATEPRRTVVRDRVESVWPVAGSVLVKDGVAYVAAGRSSYLDGGIRLYGLDPATGAIVHQGEVAVDAPTVSDSAEIAKHGVKKITQNATDGKTFVDPDHSDAFSMYGVTGDLLVGDEDSVYLRHMRFDPALQELDERKLHLFSTSWLMDDTENHRSHWFYGWGDFSRIAVAYSWIVNRGSYTDKACVPQGLQLSFDRRAATLWGTRRAGGYTLFSEPLRDFSGALRTDFLPKNDPQAQHPPTWSVPLGLRPHAMLRAADAIVLAGMPKLPSSPKEEDYAAIEGRGRGLLEVRSAKDGSLLLRTELPTAPVWDGLATAGGRIFLTAKDGSVYCLDEEK